MPEEEIRVPGDENAAPASSRASGSGQEPPFRLSGDRAAVSGRPSTGIDEVRIHPFSVARDFHVDLPRASRIELSSGAMRRHVPVNGGTVLESVVVLHRLPGVVLQWRRSLRAHEPDSSDPGSESEPGSGRGGLSLAWTLPPSSRAELPMGSAGPLILHPGTDSDASVRVDIDGGAGRWTVTSEDAGGRRTGSEEASRVRLEASAGDEAPLSLLFVLDAGDGRQRAAVTRRLSSLDAELNAWATADGRAGETELSLAVDDPEVTEAFDWARRRLHGAVGHTGDGEVVLVDRILSGTSPGAFDEAPSTDLAIVAHELLALGRHREAGELVERAVDLLADGPEDGSPTDDEGAADLLLLLGRYVLWAGDPRPFRRLGEGSLERWFARLTDGEPGSPQSRPAPHRRRFGPSCPFSPRGVEVALSECVEAIEATGQRARADGLRKMASSESDGSRRSEGPGQLDGPGPSHGSRHSASPGEPEGPDVTPAALLFDVLGARADAFFGRLRLAPRVPERWQRMSVDGIRMGDARIGLSYHTDGGRHTFRLEPTGGRIPVNLVFEPLLPVSSLEGAWIDGEPADVDRFRRGLRLGARFQIPLDAPRKVTFEEGG